MCCSKMALFMRTGPMVRFGFADALGWRRMCIESQARLVEVIPLPRLVLRVNIGGKAPKITIDCLLQTWQSKKTPRSVYVCRTGLQNMLTDKVSRSLSFDILPQSQCFHAEVPLKASSCRTYSGFVNPSSTWSPIGINRIFNKYVQLVLSQSVNQSQFLSFLHKTLD